MQLVWSPKLVWCPSENQWEHPAHLFSVSRLQNECFLDRSPLRFPKNWPLWPIYSRRATKYEKPVFAPGLQIVWIHTNCTNYCSHENLWLPCRKHQNHVFETYKYRERILSSRKFSYEFTHVLRYWHRADFMAPQNKGIHMSTVSSSLIATCNFSQPWPRRTAHWASLPTKPLAAEDNVCCVHGIGVKILSAPNVPAHEWCFFSAIPRQKSWKAYRERRRPRKFAIFVGGERAWFCSLNVWVARSRLSTRPLFFETMRTRPIATRVV